MFVESRVRCQTITLLEPFVIFLRVLRPDLYRVLVFLRRRVGLVIGFPVNLDASVLGFLKESEPDPVYSCGKFVVYIHLKKFGKDNLKMMVW